MVGNESCLSGKLSMVHDRELARRSLTMREFSSVFGNIIIQID